jgi:CheY-like chemotaxis protein
LVDAEIPELDGLEATRCIRISDTIDQPCIIAMTANAMPGGLEYCHDSGMNDLIAKPVRLKDLQGALSRARSSLDASGIRNQVQPG